MEQQSKHSSKNGAMPSDQDARFPAPTSMMLYSGLSTAPSSSTAEESDWIERFDCNQRCASFVTKIVMDCLKGFVNFSETGNVSWKIPRRGEGDGKGTGESS